MPLCNGLAIEYLAQHVDFSVVVVGSSSQSVTKCDRNVLSLAVLIRRSWLMIPNLERSSNSTIGSVVNALYSACSRVPDILVLSTQWRLSKAGVGWSPPLMTRASGCGNGESQLIWRFVHIVPTPLLNKCCSTLQTPRCTPYLVCAFTQAVSPYSIDWRISTESCCFVRFKWYFLPCPRRQC